MVPAVANRVLVGFGPEARQGRTTLLEVPQHFTLEGFWTGFGEVGIQACLLGLHEREEVLYSPLNNKELHEACKPLGVTPAALPRHVVELLLGVVHHSSSSPNSTLPDGSPAISVALS